MKSVTRLWSSLLQNQGEQLLQCKLTMTVSVTCSVFCSCGENAEYKAKECTCKKGYRKERNEGDKIICDRCVLTMD